MNAESSQLHAIFTLHIKQQRLLDGVQTLSYLPLLKKIIESSTNVKTYSAVVYKNDYSFNISVQFISLTCMNKNNVNFTFVATELQNVKFLYYSALLNSLRYLTGVYV